MIALAQNQNYTEIESSLPVLNTGFSRAGELISQINSEIVNESSKRVQTGHLQLQVKYYCNGELQKSTVTVLETFHKNIKSKETIRKMIQARATLESQGINGELTLRTKKGIPLITIKAKELTEAPKKIEIFNPKIAPQQLAEILAKSGAKAVIIQSKPQLNEIRKFAERLGIDKIIVPEKLANEIEYDPRIIAIAKPLEIKIADIAETYKNKTASAQGIAVRGENFSGLEIFEELKMPKALLQAETVITDDLNFRQDVVDRILDLFIADEEHAKKLKTPVRNSTLQGKKIAQTIQEMLANQRNDESVVSIKIESAKSNNMAARYNEGLAKQNRKAA